MAGQFDPEDPATWPEGFGKPDKPKKAPQKPVGASTPQTRATTPADARELAYGQQALLRELDELAGTGKGGRNDQLNRSAFNLGQLVAGRLLEETLVVNSLTEAGLGIGLGRAEVDKTVRSGLGDGMLQPRGAPPARVKPARSKPAAARPEPEHDQDQGEPPADFWHARAWLTLIHRYAQARRTGPWAVLGVVLARVAASTPPFVVLPPLAGTDASLNQFVALVGRSGGGKGTAVGVGAELIPNPHVDTVGVGSGEGIAHLYMTRTKGGIEQIRQAAILDVAEIDTLAALGDRRGSTLLPELRKAWSGETLGFSYADPTRRLPVPAHRYRLVLIAGVQPGRAAGLFGDEDAGTPQRFIWLPAADRSAPTAAPTLPDVPRWRLPTPLPTANRFGRVHFGVCHTARQVIDDNALLRLRDELQALDGHALLARLKVAASLALLDGRLEVVEEDWELSGVILTVSDRTRQGIQRELLRQTDAKAAGAGKVEAIKADAAQQEADRRSLARLAEWIPTRLRTSGSLTRAELMRSSSSRDRGQMDAALDHLIALSRIKAIEDPTRTDPFGNHLRRYEVS